MSKSQEKRCTRCLLVKPLTSFYLRSDTKGRTPRHISQCKTCRLLYIAKWQASPSGHTRVLQYKRNYGKNPANVDKIRNRRFRKHYNTTVGQYTNQLASQQGRCAICLRPPAEGEKHFAFDHSHETGQTRGILCASCNGGLGCFRDRPDLLQTALAYLTHWTARHAEGKVVV